MDENIIDVSGLIKKFGDFTAVSNISFDVKKGEIFAFLGPNGAGKSTTIKMLTTLLEPTSGTILLNNFNVLSEKNNVRKSFGIVFQDPSLDDELTAYENMQFHAVMYHLNNDEIYNKVKELLTFVELWDRKDDLVKTFSGGMKRRLEIARGLLHHPKILFLDEPTLGLDPQTRSRIWEYIHNLNKTEQITVFFTTHYMEEADEIASRIAIIDHGNIIKIDTPQNLKKDTKTKTLEQAFLKLTGKEIREEAADTKTRMRIRGRMWGR